MNYQHLAAAISRSEPTHAELLLLINAVNCAAAKTMGCTGMDVVCDALTSASVAMDDVFALTDDQASDASRDYADDYAMGVDS